MRTLYEKHILPAIVARVMRNRVIARQRQKVVPRAHGRVLEVGIGPGYNLHHYDLDKVEAVWGLEPSHALRRRSDREAATTGITLHHLGLDGTAIPAEDRCFDSVVVTYTLCTIPDVETALGEIHRVLAPGGALHFSEHGLAPDAGVARLQRRLEPFWKPISGGCRLSRDIPALLRAAGFRLDDLEQAYLPGMRAMMFTSWGTAHKPAANRAML